MKSVAFAVLFVCLALGCAFDSSAIEGDPELFRILSERRQSNIGSIASWSGVAVIETQHTTDDGRMRDETLQESDFAFDARRNALRWNLTIFERNYAGVEHGTGLSVVPERPEYRGGILENHRLSRFAPGYTASDGTRENTLVISKFDDDRLNSCFGGDFDPYWFFSQGGTDIDELLRYHYENYDQFEDVGQDYSIMRSGSLVTWKESTQAVESVRVFDLEKGGNLVYYRSQGKAGGSFDGHVEYEIDFAFVSGVWIPTTFRFNNRQRTPEGVISRHTRIVEFKDAKINESLEPDEFTLERLGVKAGTRVTDNIAGIGYTYGKVSE